MYDSKDWYRATIQMGVTMYLLHWLGIPLLSLWFWLYARRKRGDRGTEAKEKRVEESRWARNRIGWMRRYMRDLLLRGKWEEARWLLHAWTTETHPWLLGEAPFLLWGLYLSPELRTYLRTELHLPSMHLLPRGESSTHVVLDHEGPSHYLAGATWLSEAVPIHRVLRYLSRNPPTPSMLASPHWNPHADLWEAAEGSDLEAAAASAALYGFHESAELLEAVLRLRTP